MKPTLGFGGLGCLTPSKTIPKLRTHIYNSKIKKVIPWEDNIYMVPRPLQKLGSDSLLFPHLLSSNSTTNSRFCSIEP